MNLDDLEKINSLIEIICVKLNPEDAYWIKNLLVNCRTDEDLIDQMVEMMVAMGYEDNIIKRTAKKVKELQAL